MTVVVQFGWDFCGVKEKSGLVLVAPSLLEYAAVLREQERKQT
jgi:hypothetical protein